MTGLARETGLTRGGICKALAASRNPTYSTLIRITRALGLRLRVTMGTDDRHHRRVDNRIRPLAHRAGPDRVVDRLGGVT